MKGLLSIFVFLAVLWGVPGGENGELPYVPEDPPQAEDTWDGENSAGEEANMLSIVLTAGAERFTGTLEDNEAARQLVSRFPLTLDMGELNGNEKYVYLDRGLPVNSENPGQIHSGDLMLFGSDCLVLFYEGFSTSYSYTRLGSFQGGEGLAEALGRGSVRIVLSVEEGLQ